MSNKKYPYPIKDFKKPNQYPDPDKKSNSLLAWEFLRRNEKYQKDFDRFQKLKSPSSKRKLQKKWLPGLPVLKLFDPKDNQPRGLKLALTHAPRFHTPKGEGFSTIESLYKGDVFVAFNLNIPIKRQLEKTRKFLEKERKEQKIKPIEKNFQPHLFPLYYRILDAKAEKHTDPFLAKYFHGHRKQPGMNKVTRLEKIQDQIKIANELCNEHYIILADRP